jgi:hypothetical protein
VNLIPHRATKLALYLHPGVTPSVLEQQLRSVEGSRKDIDECASISLAKMAGFVDLLFVGSRKRSKPPLRHERAENPNVHLPIAFDWGCYEIDSYRRCGLPNEQLYDIPYFRWSTAVKQITASAGSAYISNNIVNHNFHNQCPSVRIVPVEFFTPAAFLCCSLMPAIRVLISELVSGALGSRQL